MKLFTLYTFFLLSCTLFAQELTVDEKNTQVTFFFKDQKVSGTMSDFIFTGHLNPKMIDTSIISGSVLTESLDTDNWLRNRHLRSKKYFSSKAHPRLYFNNENIEVTSDGFRVSGQLKIKGITNTVIWNFTDTDETLIGTTTINTQDYAISVYDKRSRNEVTITITMPYK